MAQGSVLRSIILCFDLIGFISPTELTRIHLIAAGRDDILDVFVVNNWNGASPVPVVNNDLTSDHLPVIADLFTHRQI